MRTIAMSRLLSTLIGVIALTAAIEVEAQNALSLTQGSITSQMRASLDERIALIDNYIATLDRGPDASSLTTANVVWLREVLSTLPLDRLRALSTPTTFASASDTVLQARDATPQLGSFSSELVYYPITPCRYIDTRSVGGPIIGSRAFDLSLTGGAYGGSLACDPKSVVGGNEDRIGALAVNVAIVGPPGAPGFIGSRPAGITTSTALVNWYEAGSGVQVSNSGIVTTDQAAGRAAEIEFEGSPTDIVVDVFGVFAAPTATQLSCVTGPMVQAVLNTTTRDYDLTTSGCPTGYRAVSVRCSVVSGDFTQGHLKQRGAGLAAAGPNCSGRYTGATSVTVSAQASCCRIPGR